MRRSIVIIIVALLGVGIVAAGWAWQHRTTTDSLSLPTAAACQVAVAQSTPNLQVELAIDALYEGLPQMKTPIAMVATQAKPFAVGCLAAGD